MPLNRKNLISDLAAGFTTGLFRIPKGMAYAKLLGVNPVYGLYSIMAAPIVASLATGTILMVSTLTIAIAICTGSVIQQAGIDVAAHPSALITITFLVGAVMGQGYLTYDLDWLAAGPSQKVFRIWNPPQAADQIECAVVQFDFQKGVAASRAFMFDTRAGILSQGLQNKMALSFGGKIRCPGFRNPNGWLSSASLLLPRSGWSCLGLPAQRRRTPMSGPRNFA